MEVMEMAAFASFGVLALAWVVLPSRRGASVAPVAAPEPVAEPVAA